MSCQLSDRLMQTLRVQTPGATDDLLSLQLFNVADEFFRRTSAWRYETQITLTEGTNEYSFGAPSGATMVRMMGVSHNGIPVPAAAASAAASGGTGFIDPALVFEDGDAKYLPTISDVQDNLFTWAIYRPDFITVSTPTVEMAEHPLEMTMALSLAAGCLECDDCGEWNVPDWMWEMYFPDWLDGTLARLYGMPAKPWSNIAIGAYHGRRFRNHMAFRKQEANRGFVYGTPAAAWRFPRGVW